MHAYRNTAPEGVQRELFPAAVPVESLVSKKLRLHEVDGDAMAPTLRSGDFVIAAPTDRYGHEGLYLLDNGAAIDVYRVQRCGDHTKLWLLRDNPYLSKDIVLLDWFNEHVVGFVVADLKVRDHRALRALTGGEAH